MKSRHLRKGLSVLSRCLLSITGFHICILAGKVAAQPLTPVNCTSPSILYDMMAANVSGGNTITTWAGFTKNFSWESFSSNEALFTNATSALGHSGSPNRTNVFFGGTTPTMGTNNGRVPTDLISNQVFNLYQGAITLTGDFLNLSTNTAVDESYVSIIPSVYTNVNPTGRTATTNEKIGISVGGSIGGNLSIINHLNDATASQTVASTTWPVSPGTITDKWYTLSTTFDIQNGNIVITDVSVNGTTAGFTYPVVIASSFYNNQTTPTPFQTHQWVNSFRAVASVDDLLDNFTITTNACYAVSGAVFNDANGLTDATVNGIGINNPAGATLYAVLVDENERIVNSTAIAANGTYSFTNVPGGIFEVRLTNRAPGAVNTAAPPSSLPAGWINTGENIGAAAGNDGSANGTILVGTSGSANVNFGIQAFTATGYTIDCATNAITLDMVSENAQISHSGNQAATGVNNPTPWTTATNNFIWESFGTDANIYGTASAIPQHAGLTGANNPTNVFYGGVWQNTNQYNTAAVSADFISKNTFSLSSASGPITLAGSFLNNGGYTEDNESYLFIVPDNYTHFQPVVRYDAPTFSGGPPVQLQREGIYVGGNITTGLFIVNNRDITTAQAVPGSIAAGWGGLAPAPGAWYTMSVTFDVQGTNLVITNVSINGVTAAYTYPVVIGTVAAHSWINSFRVGASVDDLMDDFTIARNPCIIGNVFNDVNGMGDGIVNGIGMGIIGVTQLYAVLVDGLGNVVKTVAVAADGTYSMTNVYPGNYTMRLCTSPGTIGSVAPAASLPADWTNTGEHIGAGAGSDGSANGMLLTVPAAGGRNTGSTTVLQVNFGVQYIPLPVTLIDFKAARKDNSIVIDWATATEVDNEYFFIERSEDGIHWQQIIKVPTKGNGTSINNYQEIDNNPLKNKNYYRLKQVDIDGKFTYSKIVLVNMLQLGNRNNLVVAPSPVVNNSITLNMFSSVNIQRSKIYLYDARGRLQNEYTWVLTNGTNQKMLTDLSKLSGGVYYIIVKDENGKTIGSNNFIK